MVVTFGPAYGYNVKPSKSWLIVKSRTSKFGKEGFARYGIGAALGSPTFVIHYVCENVDYWVSCAQKLCVIAKIHPHVAYCAFTHGLVGKWTYFLQTIPGIYDFLQPLNYPSLKLYTCCYWQMYMCE